MHGRFPAVSEFWLPGVIGFIFLPLFLLFVWMLSVIPAPTPTDQLLRAERVPMDKEAKRTILRQYGFGVISLVLLYTLLATMRDFRDNFSVEIWKEIQPHFNPDVFSITEAISGVVVLLAIACLSFLRNNIKAFWGTQWLMAFGILLSGGSTLFFQLHWLPPFWWMLLIGTGLFLAYIPFLVAVFERMIALF